MQRRITTVALTSFSTEQLREVVLGYILTGGEAGYFNGMRLAVHDVIVIKAYRFPPHPGWCAIRGCHPRHCSLASTSLHSSRQGASIAPKSTLCVPGDDLVLEEKLIAAFRRAIDASRDSGPRRHRPHHRDCARILRQVEEFVAYRLSSEIRIGDLCARVRTSQRTLEYLFNDYYGMSPRRYLTVHRLNAVRDCLLQTESGDVSIAAVADRCGFHHAGRFSQAYRGLFGELPSQTLAGSSGSCGAALRVPAAKRAP